jgi:glycine/D-amino acid oxidase-like deaminating enzyme
MIPLPDEQVSYWQIAAKEASFPKVTKDQQTDVLIAGGGIAGLTTAYLLKKAGLKVVVLEKNTIGSGTTNKTTGKITSQHNLVYDDLGRRLGWQVAKTYAEANQQALREIIRLIKLEKIDCDLKIQDNYVYTTEPRRISKFMAEAKIAVGLGLPASFETKTSLPFKIRAAVKFSDQARFNAQKYVLGLAALVNGKGSYVYEHSEVDRFYDGKKITRVKSNSHEIVAEHVIIATKIPPAPLMARAGYGLLEYPHTSYIVAGKFKGEIDGMYISPDKDHYSILPVGSGEERYLLIGGENHIPGLGSPLRCHRKLADYAFKYFNTSSIDYRWKGMDYMAYDNVPIIGKLYPWSENIYVATGFKKWGLTTSMVAGMILRDQILGRPNAWSFVFKSTRIKPVTSIPYKILKS